jgi:hypothetical protein
MKLRTYNIPPDVVKNDSVEFDEVILRVEMPFKLIFCIQGIEKNDLNEVALVTKGHLNTFYAIRALKKAI